MKSSATWITTLAVLAALGLSAAAQNSAPGVKPNFVVFLADDLGWGDLACYGHPAIRTPNLDRFAAQGMRFTQCYAASGVCSPSRSAILTGRTPYRNGVTNWIPDGNALHLRRSEITIATLLRQHGYATCHVGKWHLNGKFNSPAQPQPNDHGFDYWLATQNNAAPSHKDPSNFVRNGTPAGKLEGYSAVLVAEEAADWLKNKRGKEQPFYLQVWTHEPHLPIESDPEFQSLYQTEDEGLKQHHGDVTQLDHAFGVVMKALEELKLAENTFVIFTSDNGPEGRPNKDGQLTQRTRGSTGGLRGRKRDMYEGGIRVPGIVRWPGRVKPGTVSEVPVVGSDIFTTIGAMAGVKLPADRTIDGANLLPVFEGQSLQRAIPLYWRCVLAQGPEMALRDGDWKILADAKLTKFELYNIKADWQEKDNLAAGQPARLEELKRELVEVVAGIRKETAGREGEPDESQPAKKRGRSP
ncbi:MAG: sulfatase [Kiritimatiellaeota bacterium]|nr:sulfatase [Kiritimatiellota bacterium]